MNSWQSSLIKQRALPISPNSNSLQKLNFSGIICLFWKQRARRYICKKAKFLLVVNLATSLSSAILACDFQLDQGSSVGANCTLALVFSRRQLLTRQFLRQFNKIAFAYSQPLSSFCFSIPRSWGWAKMAAFFNYSQDMRSCLCIFSIWLRTCLMAGLRFCLNSIGIFNMFDLRFSMSLPVHGACPCSISQKTMPRLQMSHLLLKFQLARISGAVQRGVPKRLSFCVLVGSQTTLLNPKSLSLATPCLRSILAGLMSRWMILFCESASQPSMRCLMKMSTSFSLRPLALLRSRQDLRSPSSQYSSTRYRFSLSLKQSQNLTMKGEERAWRLVISFLICFQIDSVTLLMLILLTATLTPSLRRPKQTSPVAPLPSRTDLFMRQLEIQTQTCSFSLFIIQQCTHHILPIIITQPLHHLLRHIAKVLAHYHRIPYMLSAFIASILWPLSAQQHTQGHSTLQILLNILLMAGVDLFRQLYAHQHFASFACLAAFLLLYLIYYFKYSTPHFLTKGVYKQSKKNLRKPPPPFPNGWFNVARAQEFSPGFVKPIDINGHNLVVFRGKDSQIYALEAYCLHMGAHLGVGGQVKNESCIMCPFHGWLYDGKTGTCVDHDGKALKLKSVEYNDDLCKKDGKLAWKEGEAEKIALRKYPVVEKNGYIYVWIHAVEEYFEKPIYPMMDLSFFINKLTYRGQTEHHINCHIQDIPSNGADIAHFKYVHTYIFPMIKSLFFRWDAKWKTGDDPDIKSFFEHPRKDMREFKQRIWRELIEPYPNKEVLSIGNLQNWINIPLLGEWYMFSATIIQIGLGVVFIVLKSPLYELVFHHYIRPQGRNFQTVFHDLYISSIIPYFMSSKICELEGGQVTNDMYIWQSKSFARKTNLKDNATDEVMGGWLKWSGQFYQGCRYQEEKGKYTW